jgi:hypothetical protein
MFINRENSDMDEWRVFVETLAGGGNLGRMDGLLDWILSMDYELVHEAVDGTLIERAICCCG